MKLIALRVVVAADDAVEMKDIKPALAAMIVEHGTKSLGENGAEPKRVFWETADVLQGPERVLTRKSRGKIVETRQTELPSS